MTASIRHQNIGEKQDLSKPRDFIFFIFLVGVTVRQPHCLFAAAEVESEISHPVVDTFSDDVTIISGLLADRGEYREVGGELRVEGVCERNDGPPVQLHRVLLQEHRVGGQHLPDMVEVVGAILGEWAATEVTRGAVFISDALWR